MKTCYIIGASEMSERIAPKEEDLVIAADGGARHLAEQGIVPDLIIGDFDSIGDNSLFPSVDRIKFPSEKDETDTHLALLEGKKRGYKKFLIYGGTGGRADHTFANYGTLFFAKSEGCEAYLVGGGGYWFALCSESREISLPAGLGVSVFAYGGEALGVSIRGLKYEAENISLSPAFPLGVSNSSVGKRASISVEHGSLLVYAEGEFSES